MESKELSIVIVTFKSEAKIFKCLDSIPNNIEILIVENSNNINFKKLVESKHTNVKCILMGDNKGYSVANNVGLKKVTTKYALVLNPDTVLDKNVINNFFSTIKKIKNFWLIGPGNNRIKKDNLEANSLIEVDNLKGFAIFFNLAKFNQEFFDENFFLYFEEIDLCKKVKEKNGQIFLDNNIIISHEGASSVEKNKKIELEKNRNWHWMWSTFYFHKKYKGFLIALIIIMPKFLSSVIKTIFYFLTFNNEKRVIYFCRLSGILNSIIGKKSWYRPSLD
jgi:N-acetylglucosaminyl-diphospho-decaprenol L-rhamnosyltransferase